MEMLAACFSERKCPFASSICFGRQAAYSRPAKTKCAALDSRFGQGDAALFDKAFAAKDIHGFVALVHSQQQLEPFEERMHPWAADPETVGALCITQLAILASEGEANHASLLEANAIPALVDCLAASTQVDRIQASVVALSFLCGTEEIARVAFDAFAMPALLQLPNNPLGFACAKGTALRGLFLSSPKALASFLELDGMTFLVDTIARCTQCQEDLDSSFNPTDALLEALLNLQDGLEDLEGNCLAEHATLAVEAGAIDTVEQTQDSNEDDVRAVANELLTSLRSACPNWQSMAKPRTECVLTVRVTTSYKSQSLAEAHFSFLTIGGNEVHSFSADYEGVGHNTIGLINTPPGQLAPYIITVDHFADLAGRCGVPPSRLKLIIDNGDVLTQAQVAFKAALAQQTHPSDRSTESM